MSRALCHSIRKYSEINNIDPEVVAAIILQESGGYQFAERFEKLWFARMLPWTRRKMENHGYVHPKGPPGLLQEKRQRATSYGYMQCLGITAREHGFDGRYLGELCDTEKNLHFGCAIFKTKERAAKRRLPGGTKEQILKQTLLFWNGGGSPSYPEKVLSRIDRGEVEELL